MCLDSVIRDRELTASVGDSLVAKDIGLLGCNDESTCAGDIAESDLDTPVLIDSKLDGLNDFKLSLVADKNAVRNNVSAEKLLSVDRVDNVAILIASEKVAVEIPCVLCGEIVGKIKAVIGDIIGNRTRSACDGGISNGDNYLIVVLELLDVCASEACARGIDNVGSNVGAVRGNLDRSSTRGASGCRAECEVIHHFSDVELNDVASLRSLLNLGVARCVSHYEAVFASLQSAGHVVRRVGRNNGVTEFAVVVIVVGTEEGLHRCGQSAVFVVCGIAVEVIV